VDCCSSTLKISLKHFKSITFLNSLQLELNRNDCPPNCQLLFNKYNDLSFYPASHTSLPLTHLFIYSHTSLHLTRLYILHISSSISHISSSISHISSSHTSLHLFSLVSSSISHISSSHTSLHLTHLFLYLTHFFRSHISFTTVPACALVCPHLAPRRFSGSFDLALTSHSHITVTVPIHSYSFAIRLLNGLILLYSV